MPTPCFHGGAFFEAIGDDFRRLGCREQVINADVLDAWFPPAPSVLAALQDHLPWLLRTSPPTHAEGLARAVAEARGVPAGCVLPGAGSSGLIFLALRHWLTPASRVLLLDPTYGEYAHVCEQVIGCRVDRFPLSREQGFRLDPAAWLARVHRGYDFVVLVNPNNPTGQHVRRDKLEAGLREISASTRVWVDEAYLEYVGSGQSLERFAVTSPNVVVCKSLSKVYALSGARAAYLCASPTLLDELRPLSPPWGVSLLAQVAAVRALAEPGYYAARHGETAALREILAAGLRSVIPSLETSSGCANYVLCQLPAGGPAAPDLLDACRALGVYLRDVRSMGSCFDERDFRVAVKDGVTQARLLEVVGRCWESLGERAPRRDRR